MVTRVGGAGDLQIGPRTARPDRRVDALLLLAATFAAVAVYVAALLLHQRPPRALSITFFAAAPVCAAFALVVLESRARAVRDGALAWVSAGLTVGIVAMALQLASFPTVTTAGGLLKTSDDASAALYLVFHASLAAGAAAGALGAPVRWRAPAVAVGCAVAVLLAVDAFPLPDLIRADTYFTPLLVGVEFVLAVLIAAVTALWVLRLGRATAALYGWIGVALSLSVYDVVLNGLGAERYDAVWWGSLSLRVATYLVLAVGPLVAVLHHLRDAEAYSEQELDRRENQLMNSLSVIAVLLSSAEDLSRAVTSAQVADRLSDNARAASMAGHALVAVGRQSGPLRLVGASGCPPEVRTQLAQLGWNEMLAAPRVTGEPQFLETRPEVQQRFGTRTAMPMGQAAALATLPISLGDDVIGLLSVWDVHPRQWSATQRRMLAGLAAQGAQALARAQAHEAQAG